MKRYQKGGGWVPAQNGFLLYFCLFGLLLDRESEAHVNVLKLADVAWRKQGYSCSILLLTLVFPVSKQAEGCVCGILLFRYLHIWDLCFASLPFLLGII